MERHEAGSFALHKAAARHDPRLVETLLDNLGQEELLVKDHRGCTPLITAARGGTATRSRVRTIQLLWDASGKEGRLVADSTGKLALHWLVVRLRKTRNVAMLQNLLESASAEEVLARDREGNTVFHLLARMSTAQYSAWPDPRSHTGVELAEDTLPSMDRKAALASGALWSTVSDSNVLMMKNNDGLTPLHYAAKLANRLVLKELITVSSEEAILVKDNEGNSLCSWIYRGDPYKVMWGVFRYLPLAFFAALSPREAALDGSLPYSHVSLLQFAIAHSNGSAEVLVTRVDGSMGEKLLLLAAHAAALRGKNRVLLALLDRCDAWELLMKVQFHLWPKRVLGALCQCSEKPADADIAAAVEIIGRAPEECFAIPPRQSCFDHPLSIAMRSAFVPREMLNAILDRCPQECFTSDRVQWTLRHTKGDNSAAFLQHPSVPREAMDGPLLACLVQNWSINARLLRDAAALLPERALLAADDGNTALHAALKRSRNEDLVQAVLECAPSLRTVADGTGRMPIQLPGGRKVAHLLQPMAKGAMT
mmetsp:Transcript_12119/g.48762  ORF Transcript_12119/g.48762 Transcript_12119/m.48762 type:complete len:538 (+) Transcript_12119:82-1695(+)